MFDNVRQSIAAWQGVKRYLRQATASDALTVYSEGTTYSAFLNPVVAALGDARDGHVFYLTSDAADPFLASPPAHVLPFFIGNGSAMIYAFTNLSGGTFVMTMPDLNSFHIKRAIHPVHYVYVFHSMVSSHMIYRDGAFDHFDSVLCVGPHHMEEIRAWEAHRDLPAKRLFEHGYGPLDALLGRRDDHRGPTPAADGRYDILIAPSWGPHGILETIGQELIAELVDANHRVTVRPHPRTRELSPDRIAQLETAFHDHPGVRMEADTSNFDSLMSAHLMISDWSGAAMEFAFGLERPVLFVDVPRKVNNPSWQSVGLEPLEATYRTDVGAILDPAKLHEASAKVAALCENPASFSAKIRARRERSVFNVGASGRAGAKLVAEIAANPVEGRMHSP